MFKAVQSSLHGRLVTRGEVFAAVRASGQVVVVNYTHLAGVSATESRVRTNRVAHDHIKGVVVLTLLVVSYYFVACCLVPSTLARGLVNSL